MAADSRSGAGRAFVTAALVAVLITLVAAIWSTQSDTDTEPPARAARAGLEDPAPRHQAGVKLSNNPAAPTGGWEIIGKPRWMPLSNSYHAASFFAVNRTAGPLSWHPRQPEAWTGLEMLAAYENAPGMFAGRCEAVEVTGAPPSTRRELFAAPPRKTAVPAGQKAFFTCFQYAGTVPDKATMPSKGKLQIDARIVRIRAY